MFCCWWYFFFYELFVKKQVELVEVVEMAGYYTHSPTTFTTSYDFLLFWEIDHGIVCQHAGMDLKYRNRNCTKNAWLTPGSIYAPQQSKDACACLILDCQWRSYFRGYFEYLPLLSSSPYMYWNAMACTPIMQSYFSYFSYFAFALSVTGLWYGCPKLQSNMSFKLISTEL